MNGFFGKADIVADRPFDKEAATVVTLTVTGIGEPLGVTEGLEREHVEPAGAPLQLKATDWLKPPTPLKAKV